MTAIRARFVDVGRTLVAPSVAERTSTAHFDRDLWRALGQTGLYRLDSLHDRGAALEGLAFGSLDLGLAVSACAHLVAISVLSRHGSERAKSAYLPQLIDGTLVGACANAEPAAGTDVLALKSRARSTSNGFSLTARKRSVTNLGVADIALVSARLDDLPTRDAVNVFCVDTRAPRVFMRARTDLTGLRTSPTGSLLARGASLHGDMLVGRVGSGLSLFRDMFSEERLTTGFLYLGALRACIERAVRHAETREQFGQPIGRNQYVQEKIVRMRVAADLLEAQLARTASALAEGKDVHAELSVVKVHGIEAAITAASDLVRLLGAKGVSSSEPASRLVADLMALSILGGTVELHKITIYNEVAREVVARPTNG